jgi:hypothetical protein
MIEEYTVGKLQIARDRIYNTVEQGGLGLLKLDMLCISMGCAWINRWHREGDGVDITGSRVLETMRLGEPELINKDLVDKNRYPCARKIAESWHYFRSKMYENDGFMYHAYFFSNPGMRNRMGEMFGSGNIFSMGKYDEIRETVWETRIGDLLQGDEPKSKIEMEAVMGIELTGREYGKIKSGVKLVKTKFKPQWDLREQGKSIKVWIAGIKKGSNKFRYIMMGRGSRVYRNFNFERIRPICTLWEQMGIEKEDNIIKCGMLLWRIGEVDTDFRQYMFRWNQGMVHGNTVISHFGDVDRKCTLCKTHLRIEQERLLGRELNDMELGDIAQNVNDENRAHIFWECRHVQECIQTVHMAIWGIRVVDKKDFLFGKDLGILEATLLYMLVNMYIKYRIWKYKLAGFLPRNNNIINDVRDWMEKLCMYNKWRIMLPLVRRLVVL